MLRLALTLLGAFQATLDAKPLTSFHSMKARGLLAFLAVEAERPDARTTLATLFWPRDGDESAQKNLRQTLYHLRQFLGDSDAGAGEPYLLVTRQTVQFNTASAQTLDVAAFLHTIAQGRLAEAIAF